jgi:hypothetical protein
VDLARTRGGCVVASIFVNRLQFEPGGDFDRYPRSSSAICRCWKRPACTRSSRRKSRRCIPGPQEVVVVPPKVAKTLEGEHRPGHFQGVSTVVAKLFNAVRPHIAVFGKKDYQQLRVIMAMERQLNFGIRILPAETVREPDGLAMSSRNGYLSEGERAEAVRLNRMLRRVKERWKGLARFRLPREVRRGRAREGGMGRGLHRHSRAFEPAGAGGRRLAARGPRRGAPRQDPAHRQPRDRRLGARSLYVTLCDRQRSIRPRPGHFRGGRGEAELVRAAIDQ